jgi:hypothetical protein
MLNSYDALLLRASYGYLSPRKFDEYLRYCHAFYREIWRESEAVVPVPVWGGIKDNLDPDWQAKSKAHNDALAARTEVVKAEVVRRLNLLPNKEFGMAHIVLHQAVQEYWRDNARHNWVCIQAVNGGKIEFASMRRHEALHALSVASTESNVIHVDDMHHFIMYRTPAAK